jgi:hypothetical protein
MGRTSQADPFRTFVLVRSGQKACPVRKPDREYRGQERADSIGALFAPAVSHLTPLRLTPGKTSQSPGGEGSLGLTYPVLSWLMETNENGIKLAVWESVQGGERKHGREAPCVALSHKLRQRFLLLC